MKKRLGPVGAVSHSSPRDALFFESFAQSESRMLILCECLVVSISLSGGSLKYLMLIYNSLGPLSTAGLADSLFTCDKARFSEQLRVAHPRTKDNGTSALSEKKKKKPNF